VEIPDQFEPKSMITVFYKSNGVILVNYLDKGKVVDSNYYNENLLKPAFNEVKKQKSISGTKSFKLLHDNAKPHMAKCVK
jgi:hypothetical protein